MDTLIGHHATTGARFTLPSADRFRHTFVAGSTGTGKSALLERIALADILQGHGVLFIDVHGDSAERLLGLIPARRRNSVCYLDAAEPEWPVAMNLLEDVPPDQRAVAADGIVAAMRSIWGETGWGDRMEDILRNALTLLIEYPGATLVSLPRFLTDSAFRAHVVKRTTSPVQRHFFLSEFDAWSPAFREQAVAPIGNKVREFLAVPSVLSILGQPHSTLSFDLALAHSTVVIANLAKGRIGESSAQLLAAFLMARVLTHTMARAVLPADKRRPFHVIADEVASYATPAIGSLLSEGRKMAVSLTLALQSLAQVREPLRTVMLANCATLIAFRSSAHDAARLAEEMQLGGNNAIQDLQFGHVWARAPWSGDTFPLILPAPPTSLSDGFSVRKQSQRHFGRSRAGADRAVREALGLL